MAGAGSASSEDVWAGTGSEAFKEFKAIWDPDNRMNPGKLTDAVRVYDPVETSAMGFLTRTRGAHTHGKLETHFVFAADGGSMEDARRAVWAWARGLEEGRRSDVSELPGDGLEQHSTRDGRACCGRCWPGRWRAEGFASEAVHEALDLCLSCRHARRSARCR